MLLFRKEIYHDSSRSGFLRAQRLLCADSRKKVVASFTVDAGNTHSTTLLPMIKACCDRAGVSPAEIDLFACAVGPGSFTGVRIGVSTVKGLCAARSTPCVGVSTLAAAAYPFSVCRGTVVPVLDARRGNVYSAIFSAEDGGLVRVTEDMIIPVDELCERLRGTKSPVFFTGDACETASQKARDLGLAVCDVAPSMRAISAAGVCAIAEAEYTSAQDKSVCTAAALAPVYLRPGRAGNVPLQEN